MEFYITYRFEIALRIMRVELQYIVTHEPHQARIVSFIISDLKVYFVSISCVCFSWILALLSARHFTIKL